MQLKIKAEFQKTLPGYYGSITSLSDVESHIALAFMVMTKLKFLNTPSLLFYRNNSYSMHQIKNACNKMYSNRTSICAYRALET